MRSPRAFWLFHVTRNDQAIEGAGRSIIKCWATVAANGVASALRRRAQRSDVAKSTRHKKALQLKRSVSDGHLSARNSRLGPRSRNAASARTLWPSTEACQPSIGCSSSTRLRSAVAKAFEYCKCILKFSASSPFKSITIARNSSFTISASRIRLARYGGRKDLKYLYVVG